MDYGGGDLLLVSPSQHPPSQPQLLSNQPLTKISPLTNNSVGPRRKFKARRHPQPKALAGWLDHRPVHGQRPEMGAGQPEFDQHNMLALVLLERVSRRGEGNAMLVILNLFTCGGLRLRIPQGKCAIEGLSLIHI